MFGWREAKAPNGESRGTGGRQCRGSLGGKPAPKSVKTKTRAAILDPALASQLELEESAPTCNGENAQTACKQTSSVCS
jgi:hypothetical protein